MNAIITLFIFLFFFLDVTLAGFFNYHFFYLIGCLYYATLFFSQNYLSLMIALMPMLLLEEFLIDGRFGIHLLYILPITLIVCYIRPFFRQDSILMPCLSLTFFLIIKTFFKRGSLFSGTYIFFEICVNIIVLIIFLKYIVKGRLGNRLYA